MPAVIECNLIFNMGHLIALFEVFQPDQIYKPCFVFLNFLTVFWESTCSILYLIQVIYLQRKGKAAIDNSSVSNQEEKADAPNREVKRTVPPRCCLLLPPFARRPDSPPNGSLLLFLHLVPLLSREKAERNEQWLSAVPEWKENNRSRRQPVSIHHSRQQCCL